MPAIVQTSIYTAAVTGWAIDRTMAGLSKRVRKSGRRELASRLATMKPKRGATYLGGGFTLIAGEVGA